MNASVTCELVQAVSRVAPALRCLRKQLRVKRIGGRPARRPVFRELGIERSVVVVEKIVAVVVSTRGMAALGTDGLRALNRGQGTGASVVDFSAMREELKGVRDELRQAREDARRAPERMAMIMAGQLAKTAGSRSR